MNKSAKWLGLLCAVGIGFAVASCDEEAPLAPGEVVDTSERTTPTEATPLFDTQPADYGVCMGNDANLNPGLVSGFTATTDPNKFNCTANDIRLANAHPVAGDTLYCIGGETKVIDIVADVEQTSESARTDIGIWIADGVKNPGNAEDGFCNFFYLPQGPLDGITDEDGDLCGDMASAAVVADFELNAISVLCEDPDGDGQLEIASCVSWTQPGGDRYCPYPVSTSTNYRGGTLPATKSKCNCDPFKVPVVILSQLTLKKVVINDNGGTAVKTDWTLTGTGDQATPIVISGKDGDASITNAEIRAGTYTLTESSVANYTQKGNWVCTGDGTFTAPNKIMLEPGDKATCTVTNDDDPPKLTLKKVVINDNGGKAVKTDWTLTGTGNQATPVVISGKDGDASITNAEVSVGTFTLSESSVAGYSQKGDWVCTGGGTYTAPDKIALGLGDSATCTVTNDDDPPGLTLLKKVINDDGGTAVDKDWTLCFTNGSSACGAEGDAAVTNAVVTQGTYTLSEKDGPTNYSTDGVWNCTGGTFTSPNKIQVGLGQSASCEITNDDNKPQLTLLKKVINDNGGTAVDTDWTLCFTNGSNACGVEGAAAVTNAAVKGGTYTLSEKDGPANYSSDGVWSCTGTGTYTSPNQIALASGQSASCEITNTDDPPKLTLTKKVINDDGGTAVDTDWTLCFANGSSACGVEGAAAVTNAEVIAGTYTLSEKDGPTNYSTTGVWSCTGGTFSSPNQITLGLGQSASCEITNDDEKPRLTLTKFVDNTAGGTAVDTDWTLFFAGPSNGSGVEGAAAVTNAAVNGGTYTLSESAQLPFYSTDGVWACTGTGTYTAPDKINLVSGQSASCEITNVAQERCQPGDRLTSVSLKVTYASPDPIPLLEVTDDNGNLSSATVLQTVNPAGTGTEFTVIPGGGATFFDSQNLRFWLNGEASSDLKVHLSCSDDPFIGQTHSGSANGASITLEKTDFITTQF